MKAFNRLAAVAAIEVLEKFLGRLSVALGGRGGVRGSLGTP